MNPSRPFILRPIATSLLMAAILLIGIIGFRQLPIAALPEVDYPTMQVMTFYPGASADVVATAITAPLERQLGEVPGLTQMLSTSSVGASVITLQFNLSLNIDVAEEDVQEAINAAQNYLPSGLPMPPVYSKVNPADAPILTLALTSDSMPLSQVEDYTDTRLAQKISQLPGVGAVTIYRVRQQFVEEGFDAVMTRRPKSRHRFRRSGWADDSARCGCTRRNALRRAVVGL